MIHRVRVIFGDTDQLGVVYYANYFRYFEAARAAYLRDLGHSNRDLDRWGVGLPVVRASCHYRSPAHYEDVLEVHLHVDVLRTASLEFVYRVQRGETLIATGSTEHACWDLATRRVRRFPDELSTLLRRARTPNHPG